MSHFDVKRYFEALLIFFEFFSPSFLIRSIPTRPYTFGEIKRQKTNNYGSHSAPQTGHIHHVNKTIYHRDPPDPGVANISVLWILVHMMTKNTQNTLRKTFIASGVRSIVLVFNSKPTT